MSGATVTRTGPGTIPGASATGWSDGRKPADDTPSLTLRVDPVADAPGTVAPSHSGPGRAPTAPGASATGCSAGREPAGHHLSLTLRGDPVADAPGTVAGPTPGLWAATDLASWLGRLAPLLEYPDGGLIRTAIDCQAGLVTACPPARARLGRFLAWLVGCAPGEAEETYSRTFLVTPACAPYASVHIFGEESFRRAELMAGLADAYGRLGLETGGELPDHVALLLRLAGYVRGDELDDLLDYCLRPAVASMAKRLGPTRNPYRHALLAVDALLGGSGSAREEP